MTMSRRTFARFAAGALAAFAALAQAQGTASVDAVVGNNFGHLPMFVGVEKGLFKKHGVDVRLKVVNIGSQMVTSMQKREVQIGDMSITTFLKARHGGDPLRVIGIIMSDATRANADEPLAIIAAKNSGIRPGDIAALKGTAKQGEKKGGQSGKPVPQGWRVLEPIIYENLSVFPVVVRQGADTAGFLTLDEGLASGQVVV